MATATTSSPTLEEHRHLRALIDATAQAITVAPDPPLGWRAGTLAELRALVDAADRHFDREEKTPLYGGGPSYSRHDRALRRLKAQHTELRRHGEALLAALAGESPVELAIGVRTYLDSLLAHEREENEILQVVMNEDLGGGD